MPKPQRAADLHLTLGESEALSDAAFAFVDYGEEIKLPWNCDLNDEEEFKFVGFVMAVRAYLSAMSPEIT